MFKLVHNTDFFVKMNICKKKVALVFIIRSLFCDHNNYIYFMYSEGIVRNYEKRYTYLLRCKQIFQGKKIRLTFTFATNRHSYLGRKKVGVYHSVQYTGCAILRSIAKHTHVYNVCMYIFAVKNKRIIMSI